MHGLRVRSRARCAFLSRFRMDFPLEFQLRETPQLVQYAPASISNVSLKHPFNGFASRHADFNAEGFRLGGAVDNFRVKQVFGFNQGMFGRSPSDGNRLSKFGCGFQIKNAAPHNPGSRQD